MRSKSATWACWKIQKSMDVHRLRFIECDPQPINCLAFSGAADCPKLAVSRGDASIEIWATIDGENYYKENFLPGRTDTSVEAMVWCGKRLFSAGLTGHLHEWDLVRLRPCSTLDCSGGPVWCIAADRRETMLAAGCEDGRVRLFNIASSEGGIVLERGLDKQEGRILSLSWHPSGEFIAVGGADSTIRKMDIRSGRCLFRITLDEYKSRSTLVWDLKYLSNEIIVSADSLGKVQLWTGKHGTLRQSFQLHLADVLTLAVNEEEDTIYASGVDHKVVRLQRVKSKGNNWVKSGEVRQHTHDVRSIALSNTGLMASGGLDTQLILCPTDSFEIDSCVRYLPFSDSSKRFSIASKADVLMLQTNMSLKFWQLSSEHKEQKRILQLSNGGRMDSGAEDQTVSSQSSPEDHASRSENVLSAPSSSISTNGFPVNFLEIKTRGPLHILNSAISPDGNLVAMSTIDQMWLYRIHRSTGPKIRCLRKETLPSYKMEFTPDGSMLVLATVDGGVKVTRLEFKDDGCTFDIHTLDSQKGSSKYPVTGFQISPCGVHLATISSRNRISIYNLKSGQLLSKLPKLEGQPILFSFSPTTTQLVVFSGHDKEAFSYNVESERLSSVGGISLDRKYDGRTKLSNPNGLIPVSDLFAVYDNDCIVLIRCNEANETLKRTVAGKKRKNRSYDSKALPYQLVLSYHMVLFVSLLSDGGVVVVEQPWSDILKKLPPVLNRDRYGT